MGQLLVCLLHHLWTVCPARAPGLGPLPGQYDNRVSLWGVQPVVLTDRWRTSALLVLWGQVALRTLHLVLAASRQQHESWEHSEQAGSLGR